VFLAQYTDSFAGRYVSGSMGQLRGLMKDTPEEELGAVLLKRLSEWSEKRAAKIAADETARLSNAVALEKYRMSGATHLRWTTVGDNCPFCTTLNGRIVGIRDAFLKDGETLYAQDGRGNWSAMKSNGMKRHPPIHRGCDCFILPAKG